MSMKETGVVRRLDELGRVVIPKEIRKRLKIDNGDLVDIYTEEDKVLLKKFHPLSHDLLVISAFCNSVKETFKSDIVITDRHQIVYNTMDDQLNEQEIDKELLNRIDGYLEKEISSLVKVNLTKKYLVERGMIIYQILINQESYGYLLIIDDLISKRQKEVGTLVLSFLNRFF